MYTKKSISQGFRKRNQGNSMESRFKRKSKEYSGNARIKTKKTDKHNKEHEITKITLTKTLFLSKQATWNQAKTGNMDQVH